MVQVSSFAFRYQAFGTNLGCLWCSRVRVHACRRYELEVMIQG
jgi:hypothetical protein